MHRRDFLHLTLISSATLALAGCGFRLRGLDGPGKVIDELDLAGPDSDVLRLTEERLEAAGTRVHDGAPRVLNLGKEDFRERRLSILATGPREIEASLTLPFSLQRRRDGAYLLDQQRIEVSTRFTLSDDNLLSQDDLRQEARTQLQEEAVRRLLDRLGALTSGHSDR
jgi:LPS-assembly lipoprotein